jgi:acetyltransferase
MHVEKLEVPLSEGDLKALCDLLRECVLAGASLGFLDSVTDGELRAFWQRILAEVKAGSRVVLAARASPGGALVGSAQLGLEWKPNGRHRAEVQKVLVFPSERRKGIATRLMTALEAEALSRGVHLLVLDTSEGKGGARGLYEALGYHYAGGIPGFALDPDGTPVKNAIFYKNLG